MVKKGWKIPNGESGITKVGPTVCVKSLRLYREKIINRVTYV